MNESQLTKMNESQLTLWRQNRAGRLEKRKKKNIQKLLVHTAKCTTGYLVSVILCVVVAVLSYYYGLGEYVPVRTRLQRTVDEATVFIVELFVLSLLLMLRTPVRVIGIRICVWILCWENIRWLFNLIVRILSSIIVTILLVVFLTQVWPGPAYADILKTRIKVEHFNRPLSVEELYRKEFSTGRARTFHPLDSFGQRCDRFVDSPLVVGQHFIVNMSGKTTLGAPPFTQEFHRYVPEDIELTCHVVYPDINGLDPLTDLTFSWTLNKRSLPLNTGRVLVVASSQGQSNESYYHEAEAQRVVPSWYKKQSVLIRLLENEDFGTYRCHATSSLRGAEAQHAQDKSTSPTTHTVGNFRVIRQQPEVRDVYISHQGVMHVAVSFWRHRDSNPDQLSVRHLLNGNPFDMEHEYEFNTPAVAYHQWQHFPKEMMRDKKSEHRRQEYHVMDKHSGSTLDMDVFTWLADPINYGVHTFIVHRSFTDEETGEEEDFIETQFPLTIRQAPSFPGVLGRVDDFGDTTFFSVCWDQTVLDDFCLKRFADFWSKSDRQHAGEFVVFMYLVISVLIAPVFSYFILKARDRFISTGSHFPPEIKTLCGLRLEGRPFSTRHRQPHTLHDVFLSYHQNDSHTARTVREILKSYNLCVFDSQSDVSPGQQRLKAWSDAMDRITSFLVVVSHSYVADPELNELQFRCLYDCMLQGEVPEDRMVLVKADHCRVLPSLGPLPLLDVAQPRWRRQIHFLCEGEDRLLQVRHFRFLWRATVNCVRDLRDLVLVVWYYVVKASSFPRYIVSKLPTRHAGNVQGEPCVGGTAFEIDNDTTDFNVLLSYCSQSRSDRAKAKKVKVAIQGEGLSVFDEVKPGQEHTQLVTSAATCQAFVIVLSAAYRHDPLTRRLHFPQLLQALESGRVGSDAVLIVRTTTANDDDDDDDDDDNDDWRSPHWFQAFTTVQWTGNLSDEDHSRKVRVWARNVRHQIINNRLDDRGGRDQ